MNEPIALAEATALRPFVPAALLEEERTLVRAMDDCSARQARVAAELIAARQTARSAVLERNRLQKEYDAIGAEWSEIFCKADSVRMAGWRAARVGMAESAKTVEVIQGGAR